MFAEMLYTMYNINMYIITYNYNNRMHRHTYVNSLLNLLINIS